MSLTDLRENTVKEEIIPEYLRACRICLAGEWDVKLHNIHECKLGDIYTEVTGTTWSPWDSFPQQVCAWCRAGLLRAHTLRARSRTAHALLHHALQQQHFITNSFIRAIDRSSHNLTHTLSTVTSLNDATHYFDHNENHTPATSAVKNAVTDDQVNESVDNDLKEYDLCDSVKDNFQDSSSDVDLGNFNDVQDEINLDKLKDYNVDSGKLKVELETVKTLDSKKEVKVIKKRKRPRQKNKKNKTVKVRKEQSSKQKFSTEEDFREFEKKYDFQVQCLTEEEMQREMEKRKESDKYLKGEYKCEFCYKGFLTSATYENHMKSHDPARGDNECRLCHLRYQFPVKLRQHEQSAHRLKFRCARCNEHVRGKACAVLHAAYHAGTTFQCAHCDKQFLKKTSRTSHMRMAHPAENAAGGTCEACGETFTSRTGLKAHKTRSHKKANLPELKCRKCRIQFDNMDALKRHKETQADNKCDPSLSACEQCGETCADADELILHRHTSHAVELFTCDNCRKSFTSKASLATHIDRIHRRIRPPKADYSDGGRRRQPDWLHWASVCEHCGKRLSCLATLKIHMNKHTGERPYKCSLCPKAYMTPYGLNNHQAFHTGVRKWQCPECPATFMHQSSVYQHRKIHTGERSHQCTICDKYFTQSGSLYTHVKYVHKKETPPPRKRNKKPII